jgi:molybdopterin molybdotransferase
MAQLTDDCFAFSGPLLRIDAMERLIAERVTPIAGREDTPLRVALGRVLANDVIAPINVPPFDNSAVDGYAVRAADLKPEGETRLAIIERVTAGHQPSKPLCAGEATRIFTGAPVPVGADTVFMQEDTREEGSSVIVPAGLRRGANFRLAGEDVRAGAVILPAGRRLAAQHVALAAAVGLTSIDVRRRIRVALFSTGDEIVEPGAPLKQAALYDSNRYLLATLLAGLGAEVDDLGILPDAPDALTQALKLAAQHHDLVLTSGGVSTGEADHVRDAVEQIGRLVFWRVGIKPGRPVAMGVLRAPGPAQKHLIAGGSDSAAFVGLPGNPVAVFVTFMCVVRPLILRLAGALPEALIALPARATFSYRKKKDRREYLRVTMRPGADGALELEKYPYEGAGLLASLTETSGLAELAEDITVVEPGDTIGYLPYRMLMG